MLSKVVGIEKENKHDDGCGVCDGMQRHKASIYLKEKRVSVDFER